MNNPPRSEMAMSSAVRAAVKFFRLGNVCVLEQLDGGVANRNYLVGSDRGQYVVKEIEEHTTEEVNLELAYTDRVSSHDVPVTTFMEGPNGSRVFQFENRPVLVLEYVRGQHPRSSERVCGVVGETLARLHSIPFDKLPPRKGWLAGDALATLIRPLRSRPDLDGHPVFASYDRLDTSGLRALPVSLIHSDVHSYNLLFDDGRLVALLDWEEVGIGTSILDLASAILWMCLDRGKMLQGNLDSLISGYTSVRSLHPAELSQLTVAVKYVALTVAVWLLHRYDAVAPNDGNAISASDYWKYELDSLELSAFD